MGFKLFSSSTYDSDIKNPNPNPENFQILKSKIIGRYILLSVNYPDCTNFEGDKILLYKDVNINTLLEQKSLDPHFSNNTLLHSPIARFKPTKEGWELAEKLCYLT